MTIIFDPCLRSLCGMAADAPGSASPFPSTTMCFMSNETLDLGGACFLVDGVCAIVGLRERTAEGERCVAEALLRYT